ncbi:uncharacterized protein LOC135572711 [Oncorhynchus nerka]|uniref:uncharacterized protein LOC135572711 n=1 Tax=Oncorhynchus nerka TaxID=8023 RepID=UPI0031B8482B
MFSILPLPGHAELRASYFSCHTDNQDDEVFTFSFNLITIDANGVEATYSVNATCSLPLPWSPREVSCEENYMEVSMRSDVSCLSGTTDAWTAALAKAHSSATSTWQVLFQQKGQQLIPMSFSEARELGYVFHLTQGRLVFRSPYTPRSVMGSVSMINGSVVVVHPILFSRQRWVVMMVDWVVACITNEGMYDGAGLVWQTPTLLSPLVSGLSGLESSKISMGVDGQLLDEPITAERGYSLDISDTTVQISIPFNAAGGYRKSFVMGNMYHEFYVVHLYYEQIFLDDCGVETRLRLHRPMNTPLLIQHLTIINQTVLEDRLFTVYLGNLYYDVDLVAVTLNGHNFTILDATKSGLVITKVPQPNSNLHAYILRLPFEDAAVHKLYSPEGFFSSRWTSTTRWSSCLTRSLTTTWPQLWLSSMMSVIPPVFKGVCNEKSISFQIAHKPFDYLWEVGVGPYILTTNLAAKRGYIMQNDSKSLTLEVPLFSVGYSYKDINLKQFYGSFEIHSRLPKTLEVKSSSAKACLFQTTEVIVCSTEGVVTVVTDVTLAIPGAEPNRTFLLDSTCRPQETDGTRVLFSFGLHTCGTRVQVDHQHVTYENEINVEHKSQSVNAPVKTRDTASVITVRCVYPLSDLYKLFAYWRFDADSPGVGTILTRVPVTTFPPTTLTTTRRPLTSTTTSNTGLSPGREMPGINPRAKYIKVFSWQMNQPKGTT